MYVFNKTGEDYGLLYVLLIYLFSLYIICSRAIKIRCRFKNKRNANDNRF